MNYPESVIPRLRLPAPWALVAMAALLAAAQGALQETVNARVIDPGLLIEWRLIPVVIWGVATPWLWEAASRLRSRRRLAEIVGHVVLAGGWIVLSNALMRVPGAWRGESAGYLAADTMRGVVEFGPAALAAYVALMALGMWSRWSSPVPAMSGASDPTSPPDILAVRSGVRIHMLRRAEIRWVEADGDHVRVHTTERSYRIRGTLAAYERELRDNGFLRIHRSALVHPRSIREIQSYYRGDYVAILTDGAEVRIPRTRDDVIEALVRPAGKL